MLQSMKILIIEDDLDAASYLVKAFREAGHTTEHASDGESGLFMACENAYDVLIVDRMLPKRDGLSVIGALRDKGIETPVLILSALGQVDDRVKGLRAGGDDYLPKPYSFSELLARVEVLARRRGGRAEDTVYRVGDLELDRLSHQVKRGDDDADQPDGHEQPAKSKPNPAGLLGRVADAPAHPPQILLRGVDVARDPFVGLRARGLRETPGVRGNPRAHGKPVGSGDQIHECGE